MPRPLAAECREYGLSFGGSQFKQVADFGTGISPLFPVTHPYPATEPFIYLRDRPVVLRYSAIVHPAPHIFRYLHIRRLTALHFGFLQTPPRDDALAFG